MACSSYRLCCKTFSLYILLLHSSFSYIKRNVQIQLQYIQSVSRPRPELSSRETTQTRHFRCTVAIWMFTRVLHLSGREQTRNAQFAFCTMLRVENIKPGAQGIWLFRRFLYSLFHCSNGKTEIDINAMIFIISFWRQGTFLAVQTRETCDLSDNWSEWWRQIEKLNSSHLLMWYNSHSVTLDRQP